MMFPGFSDPVLDAQQCFRAVLEAMSRPGRIHALNLKLEVPPPLDTATAAVLLTLLDAETPVHLEMAAEAESWVRFHCGSPLVSLPQASFIVAPAMWPNLSDLCQGTDEDPEGSATLICQVSGLTAGQGWRLTGPGIQDHHRLQVDGAPAGFVQSWEAQRRRFPRGVDIILCAGRQLAALPRSVRIEEG